MIFIYKKLNITLYRDINIKSLYIKVYNDRGIQSIK